MVRKSSYVLKQNLVSIKLFPSHNEKIIELAKDASRLVSFADQARELHVCHRPSESVGSERTTIICSNNGVEPQSNACMRGSGLSCFSAFHQQNGRKKRAWRNGAWVEPLMPLTRMASLVSSGRRKRSARIITALFRSPCANSSLISTPTMPT